MLCNCAMQNFLSFVALLQIVGSLVDFFGDLSFINNTDTVEGALSLLSFGQMRVNRGLHINFNGNKGR